MQLAALAAAAALCCCLGGGGAHAANVHPIDRVITLLTELSGKVLREGQAEEVTFAKFETWCTNSIKTLDSAITAGKEAIDVLESRVEAKTKEEATLTEEISELEDELLKHDNASTAAEKVRNDAAKLYTTSDGELADTIKAISDAITELEAAKGSMKASLLQGKLGLVGQLPLVLGQLTTEQQELILTAGGEPNSSVREDILGKGDYAASKKKYSFKSGNVIDLLKELKMKFEDDRIDGTKAETNSQNAYSLATNARASAVAAAQTSKGSKTTLLGDVKTDLVAAKASLNTSRDDLKTDSQSLRDTQQTCTMKRSEWEERSGIREREMKAIAAGIQILEKVQGVRTEKPSNPVAPPSPGNNGSFLFLQGEDPRARAVNLLREEAREVNSRAFARFAEQLAARVAGPFNEVNNMIQKMIFRLMAEQKDEDDHKNWCDLELDKSNASKADKEDKIANLDAKLQDTKATVQLLTNEIEDADRFVATITEHMNEAARIRKVSKEENRLAVKDAKEAQAAITQAQAVLLDFYKDSGAVPKESWEMLQRGVNLPANPSTWSSSYTGVADPMNQPDGIITVLKEISADFSSMEADTLAQEATDQNAYEQELKSNEIEKARRGKESEMKAQEKMRLQEKVSSMAKFQKHVQGELGAVNQYLKDLAPACVEGDSTYEDRKAARVKEIDALKEAQVILADYQTGKKENATGASFLAEIRPAGFLAPHS